MKRNKIIKSKKISKNGRKISKRKKSKKGGSDSDSEFGEHLDSFALNIKQFDDTPLHYQETYDKNVNEDLPIFSREELNDYLDFSDDDEIKNYPIEPLDIKSDISSTVDSPYERSSTPATFNSDISDQEIFDIDMFDMPFVNEGFPYELLKIYGRSEIDSRKKLEMILTHIIQNRHTFNDYKNVKLVDKSKLTVAYLLFKDICLELKSEIDSKIYGSYNTKLYNSYQSFKYNLILKACYNFVNITKDTKDTEFIHFDFDKLESDPLYEDYKLTSETYKFAKEFSENYIQKNKKNKKLKKTKKLNKYQVAKK